MTTDSSGSLRPCPHVHRYFCKLHFFSLSFAVPTNMDWENVSIHEEAKIHITLTLKPYWPVRRLEKNVLLGE